jgi:elongation factor P
MASTSEIKNGLCIKFKGELWQVVEFLHVKPGKGPAFVRTKLKNLTTGKVVENTFSGGAKIEPVRVETRNYQYLYNDDMGYHFMNSETYEQVALPKHIINAPSFLKDGLVCQVVFDAEEETPLTCELPTHIEVEITYTEPGVKGDTATNTLKPAKTDTGSEIKVPLFINEGDWVKIDTRTGEYNERIKK